MNQGPGARESRGSPYVEARERLELELRSADEPGLRARLELELGEVRLALGEMESALKSFTAARGLFEQQDVLEGMAQATLGQARVALLKAEPWRVEELLEQVEVWAQRAERGDLDAEALGVRAELKAQEEDWGAARSLWEAAHLRARGPRAPRVIAEALAGLAGVEARRGAGPAQDAAVRALEAAAQVEDAGVRARVGLRVALALGPHAPDAAQERFRDVLGVLSALKMERELAEAELAYGTFLGARAASGGRVDADLPVAWLARAQTYFQRHGSLSDLRRIRKAFAAFGRRATDKVSNDKIEQALTELAAEQERQLQLSDRLVVLARMSGADEARLGVLAEELSDRRLGLARLEQHILDSVRELLVDRESSRTILEMCRRLTAQVPATELPRECARMSAQLTHADRVLVVRVDEHERLRPSAWLNLEPDDPEVSKVVAQFLDSQRTAQLLETPTDKLPSRPQDAVSLSAHSAGVPARFGGQLVCALREGRKVVGAIYCDKALLEGVFSERDLAMLELFAGQVSAILRNAQRSEEVQLAVRMREATLDSISDGVISFDERGELCSLSTAARKMLGVGPAVRLQELESLPSLVEIRRWTHSVGPVEGRPLQASAGQLLVTVRAIVDVAGNKKGFVAVLSEMKRMTSMAVQIVGSAARYRFDDILGTSLLLRRQIQLAIAASRSRSSVLLMGESGTGKELFAQALHNAGNFSGGPYVGVNCSAIPRELLESELFGHEPGAFSGASRTVHPGKFEQADGGTLLLDEIGDMPLDMQAKLLRVLQERRVQRLGGRREVPVDVRVVAATHRDLQAEVERGAFRADLYYRLRVVQLNLPPLRERREDIPLLVLHFLALFAARMGKRVRTVAPDVLAMLMDHRWPGNVRELEHCMEAAVNLLSEDAEELAYLPENLLVGARPSPAPVQSVLPPPPESAPVLLEAAQRRRLVEALEQSRGRVNEAARKLGVSRGTVYNLMRRFELDPQRFRPPTAD